MSLSERGASTALAGARQPNQLGGGWGLPGGVVRRSLVMEKEGI